MVDVEADSQTWGHGPPLSFLLLWAYFALSELTLLFQFTGKETPLVSLNETTRVGNENKQH